MLLLLMHIAYMVITVPFPYISLEPRKHPGVSAEGFLGPVVRVAPNELSFASVESWQAIYGHPLPGHEIAPKGPFYEVFAAGFNSKCIGSERDSKKYSAMRRMLSPAFSQRGLLEQEEIITNVVDKFVKILGEKSGPGSMGINVTKWFEMNSFDILGEMAFGESFHSLETGKQNTPFCDCLLTRLTHSRAIRQASLLGCNRLGSSILHYDN